MEALEELGVLSGHYSANWSGVFYGLFGRFWVLFIELIDKVRSVDVIHADPLVLRFGVSNPFDEVPEFLSGADSPRVQNSFDLVLFFSFYQIWWWVLEVGTMCFRFLVWCEERHVERVVDLPCGW